MKPFYSIPKARNHWFRTYYKYYLEKLNIKQSIYNSCFIFSILVFFSIVGLQTDNTLIPADKNFALAEEIELKKTKFIVKEREEFIINSSIKFNNRIIELQENRTIYMS
jgi:hypothetical protein